MTWVCIILERYGNSFYNVPQCAKMELFMAILQHEYIPINEVLKTILKLKHMTDMVSQY